MNDNDNAQLKEIKEILDQIKRNIRFSNTINLIPYIQNASFKQHVIDYLLKEYANEIPCIHPSMINESDEATKAFNLFRDDKGAP